MSRLAPSRRIFHLVRDQLGSLARADEDRVPADRYRFAVRDAYELLEVALELEDTEDE